jgi:hypothetical protein
LIWINGGLIARAESSTMKMISGLRRWNRSRPEPALEAAELGKLYALVTPNYAAVESYQKAQEVAKQTTAAAR